MYESKRAFKLWDYNVSHKQLLLRSPHTSTEIDNVDIVFWGVEYISIPTALDTILLRKVSVKELGEHLNLQNRDLASPAFIFGNSNCVDFVLAAGCKVLVNQLEIFDSSLVYADRDRPQEEYGKVVVKL